MATVGPVLIKPLTARESLCLACTVAGGCNEEHPHCAWKLTQKHTGHRAVTDRTKQRRERKGRIVSFMEHCEAVVLAEITAWFGWASTETGLLMVDLKRAGVVEQHGSGSDAVWRLTNGT